MHLARLKHVFHAIDEPAVPRRTHRAWGIAEEAASASELADQDTRDAALLAGLLAVRHYEIGRYGALVAWADEMAHEEAVNLLRSAIARDEGCRAGPAAARSDLDRRSGDRRLIATDSFETAQQPEMRV